MHAGGCTRRDTVRLRIVATKKENSLKVSHMKKQLKDIIECWSQKRPQVRRAQPNPTAAPIGESPMAQPCFAYMKGENNVSF